MKVITLGQPEKLTNFNQETGNNNNDDPKEVGASIFVEGDDNLASLLAEEDEPLISPLPQGSAGFGSVEPVKLQPI